MGAIIHYGKLRQSWKKIIEVIGESPTKIINDKWNEMDGNTIADLHLVLEEYVLSSVVEEKDSKG